MLDADTGQSWLNENKLGQLAEIHIDVSLLEILAAKAQDQTEFDLAVRILQKQGADGTIHKVLAVRAGKKIFILAERNADREE
jgi:hypothetical protein